MPEGTKVKQAVYLSINGDLAGVFALNYAPASAARSSLIAAVRAKGLVPILATRDFMTQGRGSYSLKFIRYEEVPQMNQAKIIEDAKKDAEEE